MNKTGVLLLAVLLAPLWAAAQFGTTAHDARSGAMGGCLLLLPDSGTCASVAWRQGYMMQGMATRHLTASTSLGRVGRVAANYSHFGDADYHEQQATLATTMRVASWLTVGVYGIYSNIGTADVHYRQQHWLDGGIIMQIAENQLSAWGGYFVTNSRGWDEERPVGMRVGITYRPLAELLTAVELSSEERLRMRIGMEYVYSSRYYARAGLSTNPLILTFGLGCRLSRYNIDLATEVHPVLGLSPQISLGLCL